jgi:c-di-GMP-related signal transduction protein
VTYEELLSWCRKMVKKPYKLIYDDTYYTKYEWADGTTYEFKIKQLETKCVSCVKSVFINGEKVYEICE